MVFCPRGPNFPQLFEVIMRNGDFQEKKQPFFCDKNTFHKKITYYLQSLSNFSKISMFAFGRENCNKQGIRMPLLSPRLILFPVTLTLQEHNVSDLRK